MNKFSSQFTYNNETDQTIVGTVDIDGATLTLKEVDGSHSYTLYFQSTTEVATLVEMLCAMEKQMKG